MSMGMRMSHRLLQRCAVCQNPEGEHSEDCPIARLDDLMDARIYVPCPKCRDGKISINNSDFYECRACHTQFTCGVGVDSDNPELVYLDDPKRNDLVPCHVLLEPGKGSFRYDEAIERLQKEIFVKKHSRKKGNKKKEGR